MTDTSSLEHRLIQLEELVTHQQHVLQQLDEVIVQLRSDADQLTKTILSQQDRIQWLAENATADQTPPDERPPHY